MDNRLCGRCTVSKIVQSKYFQIVFLSTNINSFRHFKLEIGFAIPASNDEKYNKQLGNIRAWVLSLHIQSFKFENRGLTWLMLCRHLIWYIKMNLLHRSTFNQVFDSAITGYTSV